MTNKTELRIIAKSIRKGLDIKNISQKLCEKIANLEEYKKAKNVMIFYPLENEIDLIPLINSEKSFYLPRINGDDIEICPYKIGDELNLSKFKTKEPLTNGISPKIIDIIILPALMVDKNNYRLGYGKGYYDRLLEKTNAITVIPIAKELITDTLPIQPHDKKADIVLNV